MLSAVKGDAFIRLIIEELDVLELKTLSFLRGFNLFLSNILVRDVVCVLDLLNYLQGVVSSVERVRVAL